MHKGKNNRPYYVVIHGRRPGIYKSNQQAVDQVHGFPYGKMKRVKGLKAAKQLFSEKRQTKAENKNYYVVKRGRNPGLYLDKEQALDQIKNYPYGQMKRIRGYENARAYLRGEEAKVKEKIPNIFIDGSYIQSKSFSGYGFVVVENDKLIAKDSGTILDYDLINLHSLGAELYGFIRAIEWAIANGYKFVYIIYDSTAILPHLETSDVTKGKQARGKAKLTQIYAQYKEHITVEARHKNDHEHYARYHDMAHNLSRLMSDMYHDE